MVIIAGGIVWYLIMQPLVHYGISEAGRQKQSVK
jgi:hypothetical protein